LQDGDRIFVPLNPGTVEVRGAVRDPGVFEYLKGKDLSYYIEQAGSYRRDAEKSRVMVVYPNGSATRKRISNFFRPEILSGSVIEVPVKEPKLPRTRPGKNDTDEKPAEEGMPPAGPKGK